MVRIRCSAKWGKMTTDIVRSGWKFAAVVTAMAALSACGSGSNDSMADSNGGDSDTRAPAVMDSTSQPDTSSPSTTAGKKNQTTRTTTNLNPAGGNNPEDFLMPNVLCMNLQAAQDEIQDHGVLFSRSTDATGQGRQQLIDSNWIVVKQSPAPGTKIAEGDALLSAVKIGESTGGICP